MTSRTTIRTYGSRGATRVKSLPEDTPTNEISPTCKSSSPIQPQASKVFSLSTLKRKGSNTGDLRSFFETSRPSKKVKSAPSRKPIASKQRSSSENISETPALAQLHFLSSKPILTTCKLCDLSYTKGAVEDEELHRTHCLRVVRGMEWSREERALEKPLGSGASDVEVVEDRCVLPNGIVGRIVRIRCDVTKGKLGQKVTILLSTVNKALSAPPLPGPSLASSKAYVMIVPASSSKSLTSGAKSKVSSKSSTAERIVGCVITSRITSAMRVVDNAELESSSMSKSDLVCVDIDDQRGNVYCDPSPIPATLGIPRLFVVPSHRRQGIAQSLLNAAAKTAIWGCPLDPASGQIAFSQPTASGQAVMKAWGGGQIHIYDEQ